MRLGRSILTEREAGTTPGRRCSERKPPREELIEVIKASGLRGRGELGSPPV